MQVCGTVCTSLFSEHEFILGIRKRGSLVSLAPAAAVDFRRRYCVNALRNTLLQLTTTLLIAAIPFPSCSQTSYPEHPVRIIYGFQAGADLVPRILADGLSSSLGKPFIIDNMVGAAGNIS